MNEASKYEWVSGGSQEEDGGSQEEGEREGGVGDGEVSQEEGGG